jgi:adenosylmethionine-8-amino-7-oxononanoate aminotransferase
MHAWHHDQAQLDRERHSMLGQSHVGEHEGALRSVAPDIQMMGKCLAAGIMPAAGLLVSHRIAEGLG